MHRGGGGPGLTTTLDVYVVCERERVTKLRVEVESNMEGPLQLLRLLSSFSLGPFKS